MAEAKHGRRTPRLVLVAASLGAALLIPLAFVIVGASGSGHPQTSRLHSQTDNLDTHRDAPASRDATPNTTTTAAPQPTRDRPGPVPPAPAGDKHTDNSTDTNACGGSSPPFDGVPCRTDNYAPYVTNPDAAPAPFDQPFFLAFTAALGTYGNDVFRPGTTPLPATTKIDWVKAWQY